MVLRNKIKGAVRKQIVTGDHQHPAGGIVYVKEPARAAIGCNIMEVDGIVDIVEDFPEFLLALAKFLFSPLPFGDVFKYGDKPSCSGRVNGNGKMLFHGNKIHFKIFRLTG